MTKASSETRYTGRILMALAVAVLLVAGVGAVNGDPTSKTPVPVSMSGSLWLNVKDFGAVGDGKADDTVALQKAIDTAVADRGEAPNERAVRQVILPPGVYRVTDTLKMDWRHNNLVLEGVGGQSRDGNTQIIFDGEEGKPLLQSWCQSGLQLRDLVLNGNKKAGKLLRINSTDPSNKDQSYIKEFGQRAATGYIVERVAFLSADTGISFGDDAYINGDCSTFKDCQFKYLETAFKTNSQQNLQYLIQRPSIGWCGTGFYFKGGGYVKMDLVNLHHVDIAIRVEGQGINSGVFEFSTVRPEQGARTKGKRPVSLMASGETNIKMTGLQTTCCSLFGPEGDRETPAIVVGPTANVVVESSQICGKIAKITGRAGAVPSFVKFDNCRFRCAADPRKDITADENSGYRFIDCVVTVDDITREKEYKVHETFMIKDLSKYPKNAR